MLILSGKELTADKLRQMLKEFEDNKTKTEVIRKALILTGIPKRLTKLRNKILKERIKVANPNIRVITRRKLLAQINSHRCELENLCSHPVIYQIQGYGGSRSEEFENAYPTRRYCLACGLFENAADFKCNIMVSNTGTVFSKLSSNDERIVLPEPFRQPRNYIDIWQPLEALLHPVELEIAKSLNLNTA